MADQPLEFSTPEEEINHWKSMVNTLNLRISDLEMELEEHCNNSNQLELELETSCNDSEKKASTLEAETTELRNAVGKLTIRLQEESRRNEELRLELENRKQEIERLQGTIRDLEQENDKFDKKIRETIATEESLERSLETVLERLAFLETDMESMEEEKRQVKQRGAESMRNFRKKYQKRKVSSDTLVSSDSGNFHTAGTSEEEPNSEENKDSLSSILSIESKEIDKITVKLETTDITNENKDQATRKDKDVTKGNKSRSSKFKIKSPWKSRKMVNSANINKNGINGDNSNTSSDSINNGVNDKNDTKATGNVHNFNGTNENSAGDINNDNCVSISKGDKNNTETDKNSKTLLKRIQRFSSLKKSNKE